MYYRENSKKIEPDREITYSAYNYIILNQDDDVGCSPHVSIFKRASRITPRHVVSVLNKRPMYVIMYMNHLVVCHLDGITVIENDTFTLRYQSQCTNRIPMVCYGVTMETPPPTIKLVPFSSTIRPHAVHFRRR